MIKAILFDGDGVTIAKHKYFSEVYAKEHNIPLEKFNIFFRGPFQLCQKGKADLKTEIAPFLSEWNKKDTVDNFLNYWFDFESKIDQDVIAVVAQLRAGGIICCLSTDQEKYRAEYISKILGFDELFDKCFYSCELGFRKSETGFFDAVIKNLGFQAREILYFDDDQADLDMAKKFGIQTHYYTDFRDFVETLKSHALIS